MTGLTAPLRADVLMTLDRIIEFGGLVRRRATVAMPDVRRGHHADMEAARSAGLRGPVAYSLHYNAHVAKLLEEAFGARWTNGGALAMSFIRPVFAGDEVAIRIGERALQRVDDNDTEGRLRLQVDVYNQLGELVAAGHATLADAT